MTARPAFLDLLHEGIDAGRLLDWPGRVGTGAWPCCWPSTPGVRCGPPRDLVRVATATQPDPDTGCADYPHLAELLRHGQTSAADTALIVRTLDQLPTAARGGPRRQCATRSWIWTGPGCADAAASSASSS
ncbi:MAG: hypothetical protein ACR2F6_11330 [Mycobacteriales bacterium]